MADCQLTGGYAFYFWTFFMVKRSYKIPARNLFHLFQWSVLWHMKREKTWVAKQNLASLSSNSKLHWNVAFQTLISLCDSATEFILPVFLSFMSLWTFIPSSLFLFHLKMACLCCLLGKDSQHFQLKVSLSLFPIYLKFQTFVLTKDAILIEY